MWTSLKKILPFNINKLGLSQVLELNDICLNWDEILSELFGEDFKNKSRPISFKDKTLVVDCLNSIWASELQTKQIKIIECVNKKIGKGGLEKIRFIS